MNSPLDRSRFLGGSDAAAVMGLSPWSTPVELWLEKTGRKSKPLPDAQQAKRFERGHILEPFIRDMAVDKLRADGLEVELIRSNERYTDAEYPFLACEIDFELRVTGKTTIGFHEVEFDGEHINCDAKSVTGFARKKWGTENTEDVPIEYAAQFMHGLMVTGRRYCLVAALRSFDDVDIYWTVRDDETIAGMRPRLVSFWLDHVQADVAPDPLVFTDIKELFPVDNGGSIEATPEIAEKVSAFAAAKAAIKLHEEQETALQFDIGSFMSPHSVLTYGGKELLSWKAQSMRRLDQKALAEALPTIAAQFTVTSTLRVMRLKQKKGI